MLPPLFIYNTIVTKSPYLLSFIKFFCKAFLFGARKTKSKNSYNVFLTILGKFEEQALKKETWGRVIVNHEDPSDYIFIVISLYQAKLFVFGSIGCLQLYLIKVFEYFWYFENWIVK